MNLLRALDDLLTKLITSPVILAWYPTIFVIGITLIKIVTNQKTILGYVTVYSDIGLLEYSVIFPRLTKSI